MHLLHPVMIERFFALFDRIVRWYGDFIRYLDDVQEGVYIQYTLEGILADTDGKQLLVEASAAFGLLLVMLEEQSQIRAAIGTG